MRSEAGTLLLESGIIDEVQLQKTLSASVSSGQTFVQTLITLGYVNDIDLASFFASRLHIPLAEKSMFLRLPAYITRLIPLDIVLTHRTVPVMLHQGVLHMAMSDPTNREAIEEISFITGYNASPVAAPDSLLEQAMEEYYCIAPDNSKEEILQIAKEAQGGIHPQLPILSQLSGSGTNAGSHFEASPGVLDFSQQTSKNLTASLNADQSSLPEGEEPDQALVVEPASGELAELFGMASSDNEIIHLTKTKKSSVTSINAAIEKKVASVLSQEEKTQAPVKTHPTSPREQNPKASSQKNADESDNNEGDELFPPLRDSARAKYLVENATDRDEIARTLIQYTRALMQRAVIFIVKRDMLVGWMGTGPGIKKNQIKGIILPLSSPSVFKTVKETLTDYFGSMPRTSTNEMFLAALGESRPRQVLLIPITVRQKAVCILYGDCGNQPGFRKDLSSVHLLALDASLAFERIIIEKKMNRLVKK